MKNRYDLTEDNTIKTVILFFLPFLLTSLIRTLRGVVDLMVMGWYCFSETVAAVLTGTQVMQIVTSFISGLTLGGTVTVGKYVEMKWIDDIKKAISTSLHLFTATGVLLTVLLLLLQTPILTLLRTPKAAFSQARQYVSVCAMGVFLTCEYSAISAILQGYGNSKSLLLFVAVTRGLNVTGDIFFVKQLHMGVTGAALATMLSQTFSMICAIIYPDRRDFIFRFHLSNFRIYGDRVCELVLVGIPISLQECTVRLLFLYLISAANALGIYMAFAVGIANKYDMFAMLPVTSVPSALASIVAQNYGVKKYHRISRALFTGITFTLPFFLAFFLWAQISPAAMIGVFSTDSATVGTGVSFFKTCSFDYLCVLLVFSSSGYLNGRGKIVFTMFSHYFGALTLCTPLIYLVCRFLPENLDAVGTTASAVSGVMAVYTLVYTLECMRHNREAVWRFVSPMYQ